MPVAVAKQLNFIYRRSHFIPGGKWEDVNYAAREELLLHSTHITP